VAETSTDELMVRNWSEAMTGARCSMVYARCLLNTVVR
jgi:hypothetical protein